MFNSIQRELEDIVNRGLDRSLRIAVTGLSRSGKTAFITSFINQLLAINEMPNGTHIPLFEAARHGNIKAVRLEPQRNLSVPRFEYPENMNALNSHPPLWPESTRGISETRIEILYQHSSSMMRYLKESGRLYLEIFDYPGEWLLDLPLLELNFQQWSQSLQQVHQHLRTNLATAWLEQVKALDLTADADEAVLAALARSYTNYLHACKDEGLQLIQPGRFVLPGELEGAPVLQFFPLLHLNRDQWQALERKSGRHSYFYVLQKRYKYYQDKVVKKFYEEHFSKFDRQIILVDCLTPLNHSQFAFDETKLALTQLFKNFNYGNRSLWQRLFSPNIDKLLFTASKADHITADQLDNLTALLRSMIQQGATEHIAFSGIDIDYSAIAAIRATKQVVVTENGETFKALQGVRSSDKQPVVLYPGSVPNHLPNAQFWQNNRYEFDSFEPQPLNDTHIPHLRMDAVLQFLLGDKLD